MSFAALVQEIDRAFAPTMPGCLAEQLAVVEDQGLPRPYSITPRPVLLSNDHQRVLAEAAERHVRAFKAAGIEALAKPGVEQRIAPLGWERPFLPFLQGQEPAAHRLVQVRVDVMFDPDTSEVALLEVQASDPSGPGWVSAMHRAFEQTALGRALGLDDDPVATLGTALARAALARAPSGRVRYAVQPGVLVEGDYRLVAAEVARAGGEASVHAWSDPDLVDRSQPGLVVRDALEEMAEAAGPEGLEQMPLLQQWKEGAPVINAVGDHFLDRKVFLEDLGEALPDDQGLLRTFQIPDVPNERRASLEENPDRWVLKPSDGYGGIDVIIGAEVSSSRWQEALERASREPWVAQHYRPLPRIRMPRLVGGRIEAWSPRIVLSSWVVDGRFAGAFARLAEDPVINVHRGGCIAPVFFVDESCLSDALRRAP